MRVLGLDPGSRHFGWGVIQREGTKLLHIAHGVVDVDTTGTFGDRLVELERALVDVVGTYRPACASLESLIFAKDPIAASKLGHARGVALLVCARAQLSAYEYAPTLIKRAVTGTGRAEKHQVGQMIRILLKLESLPRADASDALAIALTHLQQVPVQLTQGRLSPASAGLMALLSTSAASGVRRGHKRRGSTV